jgi:site-specific recombinase XerD
MVQEVIEEYVKYLKSVRSLSNRTIGLYYYWLTKLDSLEITQSIINNFVKKHNNSLVRAMLLSYISFLEFEGADNIYLKVPPIYKRRKSRIPVDISDSELDKLREHFLNRGYKYALAFELMYQGALRCMEVETIKVNSFDWEKWLSNTDDFCELRVIGKGDKERKVLVSSKIMNEMLRNLIEKLNIPDVDFLKEYLRVNETPLFKQMKYKTLYYNIATHTSGLLGRRIRPHEIRHTRANNLSEEGVDIYDIKNYLGHSSIATTEIYVRRSTENSLKNIKEKIG